VFHKVVYRLSKVVKYINCIIKPCVEIMKTCLCNLPDRLEKYQHEHASHEENVAGSGMPLGKMKCLSDDVSEQMFFVDYLESFPS
jgi:hypothetical protein